MLYMGFFLQACLIGICAWNFFDDRMGRAPFRMVIVGVVLCGAGVCLGTSIAHFEGVWLFSNEHSQLELVSQLINVAITAAGGNVLAAGLVLRAEMASERTIKEAKHQLHSSRVAIVGLLRDHKHLALEESTLGSEETSRRSSAIWNLIERYSAQYRDANDILRKMGLEEEKEPYPRLKRNPSGRRI
ncbi:hypothetical protein V4C53_10425 [Paraburkholderia azotifigens]|uniref:hypothetical protein n=1 Tax=Paraburkholderia azotifigens TaxID=2057004 RepID=UPI003181296A